MLKSLFWTLMIGNPVTLKYGVNNDKKKPLLQLLFNLSKGGFFLRDEKSGLKKIEVSEVKKLLEKHLNEHLQHAIVAGFHDLAKEIQEEIEWVQFEM